MKSKLEKLNKLAYLSLVVSSMMFVVSCSSGGGSDDDDDDDDDDVELTTPIGSIAGTWSATETFTDDRGFGDCTDFEAYTVTISQDGNDITVSGDGDVDVDGTLSGNALKLDGDRPTDIDDEVTVKYSSITATIPADCSSFTASTKFKAKVDGDTACTGTSTIEAIRLGGGTC